MRYYIADCHFFHKSLLDSMDCRGFSNVEEMNRYMIEKWNKKVRSKDEVVILGDLSLGNPEETNEMLEQLQGKLFLVVGNHDYRYLRNASFHKERFEWIKPYAELHDNGKKVVLSHYPMPCYNGQYQRTKKGEPKSYMLYGHVHDTHDQQLMLQYKDIMRNTTILDREGKPQQLGCNMINCFCMYSDYEPWSLEEWIAYENKKDEERK